jgi:hypothetical protein
MSEQQFTLSTPPKINFFRKVLKRDIGFDLEKLAGECLEEINIIDFLKPEYPTFTIWIPSIDSKFPSDFNENYDQLHPLVRAILHDILNPKRLTFGQRVYMIIPRTGELSEAWDHAKERERIIDKVTKKIILDKANLDNRTVRQYICAELDERYENRMSDETEDDMEDAEYIVMDE